MVTKSEKPATTKLDVIPKEVAVFKGALNVAPEPSDSKSSPSLALVRKDIADAMNSKNVSFLLGSGCSSARNEAGEELGIPTMQPMATQFLADTTSSNRVTQTDRRRLKDALGLDLDDDEFKSNLETLMEVLYGYRFALQRSKRSALRNVLPIVEKVIQRATSYVLATCIDGQSRDADETVLKIYQHFYRRLVQRDRALPRPWVFTTNYDMFSETAMDRLGIPYINGFQGSVERRFNPAVFRYALAEQLDITNRKWGSVDSLIYFAKLHGSVSWESRDDGLFPVVETSPQLIQADRLLIYPTPAKQNASFASPYSDMFREFQTRVARDQSVLIALGYSFGDEHVNNIIFQALTIPTFRLIAFVDPGANAMTKKLRGLNDPRIWIIGTEDKSAAWKGHYFANFVEEFMSAEGEDPSDGAIERVLTRLMDRGRPEQLNDDE